jgi:hypothetical protein
MLCHRLAAFEQLLLMLAFPARSFQFKLTVVERRQNLAGLHDVAGRRLRVCWAVSAR